MNYKLLLFAVVGSLLITVNSGAQSYFYLPYTGTTSEYQYTTLGTVIMQGATTGLKDTLSAWQTMPFKWDFYGQKVTGYYISDNGYITFDSLAKGSNPNNMSVPDTNAPKNAIFALWDQLNLIRTGTSGDYLIHKWIIGTAPKRVLVIHWFNIHHQSALADGDSRFFFAIRIYENGPKKFDIVHDWKYNTTANSTATVGVQNKDATMATMVIESPFYNFPALGSDPTDDKVFEFYNAPQPSYDMSVTSIKIPQYLKTGITVPVTGTIRNMGSQNVTSFTLNYSIDGGTPVSMPISSVYLLPGDNYKFTHPTSWTTPSTENTYVVSVWATNINGQPDANTSNDTLGKDILVIANSVQRIPLHEVFTSSTCGPCNAGNANLDAVFEARPDHFTCVKYQMNYPGTGDPYYTSECGDRSNFYGGINSIPRLEVDGGYNQSPYSYSESILDSIYGVPAFIDISPTYQVSDKTVNITAILTPMAKLNPSNLRLYIAIVEKTTSQNVKSNGEAEFHWVMKKMVTNSSGTPISSLKKDTAATYNKSFTFRGNYTLAPDGQHPINIITQNSVEEFTDLAVVVWVQDVVTREVYQSAWARDLNGIDHYTNNYQFKVFPNPLGQSTNFSFTLKNATLAGISVYNIFGQQVYSSGEEYLKAGSYDKVFDASKLPSGTYIAVLKTGEKSTTIKLIK